MTIGNCLHGIQNTSALKFGSLKKKKKKSRTITVLGRTMKRARLHGVEKPKA